MPRWLAVATLLMASGCSCGEKRCDPAAGVAGSCDGDAMQFCQDERHWGFDFGSHMQRSPCVPGNKCRDFGNGSVGCVHFPATPCDPQKYVGGCDGNQPLFCGGPSSFVTEEWVIANQPCAEGQRCVETPQGGDCKPN